MAVTKPTTGVPPSGSVGAKVEAMKAAYEARKTGRHPATGQFTKRTGGGRGQ